MSLNVFILKNHRILFVTSGRLLTQVKTPALVTWCINYKLAEWLKVEVRKEMEKEPTASKQMKLHLADDTRNLNMDS